MMNHQILDPEQVDLLQLPAIPQNRTRFRAYKMKTKPLKTIIDDYEIKETIGTGAFGKVKKAYHRPTGQTVAVKIFNLEKYDEEQLRSFEQQIQIQRNLFHQNIAQIYEVVKKQGQMFVFMEYCQHGELFDRINKSGPLHERAAAKVFYQLLSALLYLNQNNISHRDIKAENILFDENDNVKLVDFGFSCIYDQDNLRRTICGTPSYTPPQIIKRYPYRSELVDVWCLGVTLYVMLAAQLPFQSENPEKRKKKICQCKYDHNRLSPEACSLLDSIFVEQIYRPTLLGVKESDFCKKYEQVCPQFINLKKENIIFEEVVLREIEEKFNVERTKVIESVRKCIFNKYHALYYLCLRNQKAKNTRQQSDISQFKKEKKSSLLKLHPLSNTPTIRRKEDRTPMSTRKGSALKIRSQPRGLTIDITKARLRNNVDPDSPRRLLDCLAAYKA